ncbi:hypothetical protein [Fluoribacter gormanii]|nr:hypothetical protein [Fluoribacter gormanii]
MPSFLDGVAVKHALLSIGKILSLTEVGSNNNGEGGDVHYLVDMDKWL